MSKTRKSPEAKFLPYSRIRSKDGGLVKKVYSAWIRSSVGERKWQLGACSSTILHVIGSHTQRAATYYTPSDLPKLVPVVLSASNITGQIRCAMSCGNRSEPPVGRAHSLRLVTKHGPFRAHQADRSFCGIVDFKAIGRIVLSDPQIQRRLPDQARKTALVSGTPYSLTVGPVTFQGVLEHGMDPYGKDGLAPLRIPHSRTIHPAADDNPGDLHRLGRIAGYEPFVGDRFDLDHLLVDVGVSRDAGAVASHDIDNGAMERRLERQECQSSGPAHSNGGGRRELTHERNIVADGTVVGARSVQELKYLSVTGCVNPQWLSGAYFGGAAAS